MSKIDQVTFERAVQTWQIACGKLGVKIVSPYLIKSDGEAINCLGFLPDFGGIKGMVIGAMDLPKVRTDKRLFRLAQKDGLYCSFVNASAFAYKTSAEVVFKDALNDWGYYGAVGNCPLWFAGINYTAIKKNRNSADLTRGSP